MNREQSLAMIVAAYAVAVLGVYGLRGRSAPSERLFTFSLVGLPVAFAVGVAWGMPSGFGYWIAATGLLAVALASAWHAYTALKGSALHSGLRWTAGLYLVSSLAWAALVYWCGTDETIAALRIRVPPLADAARLTPLQASWYATPLGSENGMTALDDFTRIFPTLQWVSATSFGIASALAAARASERVLELLRDLLTRLRDVGSRA